MPENKQPIDIDNLTSALLERAEYASPREVKEAAIDWAKTIAQETGKDDGTRDLKPLLESYIQKINTSCAPANAKVILNELSEAVESQYVLAEFIEKSIQQNSYNGANSSLFTDPNYPEATWIKDTKNLVTFLKTPLSDESTVHFTSAQPDFPADRTRQFHQEYWALSNNQRAEFLDKVFNVGKKNSTGYKAFLTDMQDMLNSGMRDEFLPPEHAALGDSSAYQIGSKITEAMLKMKPPPKLITKIFASFLDALHDDALDQASDHPRTTDPQERFGYRLGRFMNNLGPGAAKVAQFGHSLPIAPDEWMEGLSGSKSNAGRPSRLEYLTWINNSVPQELRDQIQHIGEHKGTGSYLSTYGIELKPEYVNQSEAYTRYRERYAGKNLVLSLKKPNAREEALEFTDYLLELGEKIAMVSPAAAKSVEPLMELIKQGKHMVEKETDLHYSARQEELASQLYENLKITAGSDMVNYYTQGAFDYGESFRVSLCVDGKHFNELPENTASEKAIKRRAAVALFTTELYLMLSGKPFDHDRHGDNQGIEVSENKLHIGNFDTGALALTPPTDDQKKMFADCLVNALANSARNKFSPLSSLKHTIAKVSRELGPDRKHDLDYINSMLRATMSLGDYMDYMKPKDYTHAFLAVAETGDIDPVILSRLMQRIQAIGVTKGGDYVSSLPVIGGVMDVMSRAANYTGLSNWTGAQGIIENERVHESTFYPSNPNPNRRIPKQSANGDDKSSKKLRPKKEFVPAVPVTIDGEDVSNPTNFTARILASIASHSKRWVK